MSALSKRVYSLNLGVPKEFEDMSAYSAFLGNGVVELEKQIKELRDNADELTACCKEQQDTIRLYESWMKRKRGRHAGTV